MSTRSATYSAPADDLNDNFETVSVTSQLPHAKPPAIIELPEEVSNNPKDIIKYHINWFGFLVGLGAVGYYGYLIYQQIQLGLPEDLKEGFNWDGIISLRYVGALVYFLAVLCQPRFLFEQRNAEAPLILSTVMQLYFEFSKSATDFKMVIIASSVVLLSLFRRRPYFRVLLNPWTKDKTELIRLIRLARKAATDL